jgi:hypothetical protein
MCPHLGFFLHSALDKRRRHAADCAEGHLDNPHKDKFHSTEIIPDERNIRRNFRIQAGKRPLDRPAQ